MQRAHNIIGLILAGGRARRMGGGDKALLPLAGKTLLARVVERANPQVDELLINANGDPERFATFGCPVIADRIRGFLGPLAGIYSGLAWMKDNRPQARWLASFACDTPFFPRDLVARLSAEEKKGRASVIVAQSGGRQQGVFALWSAGIEEMMGAALVEKNVRKVDDLIAQLPHKIVDIPKKKISIPSTTSTRRRISLARNSSYWRVTSCAIGKTNGMDSFPRRLNVHWRILDGS